MTSSACLGKLYFAPLKAQELFTYLQMSIPSSVKCKSPSLFPVEVDFVTFRVLNLDTQIFAHLSIHSKDKDKADWIHHMDLSPPTFLTFPCPWYIIENLNLWTWLTYFLFCSDGAAIMTKSKERQTTFDYSCIHPLFHDSEKKDGNFLKLYHFLARKIDKISFKRNPYEDYKLGSGGLWIF